MKKRSLHVITMVVALLFLVAQHSLAEIVFPPYYKWAIASFDKSRQELTVFEYRAKVETAPNGKDYCRIALRDKPQSWDEYTLLRYGFIEREKRVYLYDFETEEESICIDYTLQKGDIFTTYNGETWEVVENKDTLVREYGVGHVLWYEEPRKVLTVLNVNDGRTDRWMEGFGSFTNHLMIEKVQPGISSYLLWMDDESHALYITNEFSDDPLFGHDTGWLPEMNDEEEKESSIEYRDGELILDYWYRAYPTRYYYLRQGDYISTKYSAGLGPFPDCEEALYNDVVRLKGVPVPASGNYTTPFKGQLLTTDVRNIIDDTPKTHAIFDLQGRKLDSAPAYGIYIKDGIKRLGK